MDNSFKIMFENNKNVIRSIDPEEFKPVLHGVSDKYSWNIYKWLKKNKKQYRVFKSALDSTDTLFIGTGNISTNIYYVADMMHVRTGGSGRKIFVCDHIINAHRPLVEITNEFWDDYRKRGVCAINNRHHAWDTIGNIRTCIWCDARMEAICTFVPRVIWVPENSIQEALA